jgi:hypothetical protein
MTRRKRPTRCKFASHELPKRTRRSIDHIRISRRAPADPAQLSQGR